MNEAIIRVTENREDLTISCEIGFSGGKPDEYLPSHVFAMFVVNNFEEIVGMVNATNATNGTGFADKGFERNRAEPGANDRGDGPKIEIVHG